MSNDYVSQFGPQLMQLDASLRAPPAQDQFDPAMGEENDGGALPDEVPGGALPEQSPMPEQAPVAAPATLPLTLQDHLGTYTDKHFAEANAKVKAETGKSLNEQYDELAAQGAMPKTSKALTDRQKSELMIHFGLSMMQQANNRPAIITPQNIGQITQGGLGGDIGNAGQSTLAMAQGMQQQNQAQAQQQEAVQQKVGLARIGANKDLALKDLGAQQASLLQTQKDTAAMDRAKVAASNKTDSSKSSVDSGLTFDKKTGKYSDPDGHVLTSAQVKAWNAEAAKNKSHSENPDSMSDDDVSIAAPVVMSDPARMRDYATFGKAGQAHRDQINEEIAKQLKGAGMTSRDLTKIRLNFNAQKGSITKLTAQQNAIDTFEGLARNNGERLMELVDKIDDTGVPIIEAFTRPSKKGLGSDDMAEAQSVLTSFQTEAAKILSGNPNMTGVISDSARHELQKVVDGSLSASATRRVVKRLFTEMDVRSQMYENTIKKATDSATSTTPQNDRRTAPPVVPQTNARGWQLHTDSQGRRAYVSPDKKQFEVVK